MISHLRLQRFKCFEDQEIHFGKLTLLVGGNATGKSSAIQALLLLRQSIQTGALQNGELSLNGSLVNIGTAQDALYSKSQEDSIVFSLTDSAAPEPAVFEFAYERGHPSAYTLLSKGPTHPHASSLAAQNLTYLNAERLGPRLLYPMTDVRRESVNIGIHGEYAAQCLAELGIERIRVMELAYPGEANLSLKYQTELWMRRIVPNLDIEIAPINQADQVRIGFKNQGAATDYLRPTNTGFGISYTLPIVVAALIAEKDSILIVENPEAHLHPAGQSEIGQFLAWTAAAGIQVIVETHSDHVLNGIRLAVKQATIQPHEVSIQFFANGNREQAQRVVALKIDTHGRIDSWPEGFFDQFKKDLMELL